LTNRLSTKLYAQELLVVGNEPLPLLGSEFVPDWVRGPMAEIEMTGGVTEVGGADGGQHLLKLFEPEVRVPVEVAAAAAPDTRDCFVWGVVKALQAERLECLEPPP
jgi:hypothetical protein